MSTGRIVSLEAVLRPTSAFIAQKIKSVEIAAQLRNRKWVEGSEIDLRVKLLPKDVRHKMGPLTSPTTHLWAVVECWTMPDGSSKEEILFGSTKPSAIEAMAAGLPFYEQIRAARNA